LVGDACARALEQSRTRTRLLDHRSKIIDTGESVGVARRIDASRKSVFSRESETSLPDPPAKIVNYRVIANTFNPLTHRR
jgi:hypothetical protein